MWKVNAAASAILSACLFTPASAQAPAKVDFRRDVQPLLQARCVGCHGPSLQMNRLRLDQRRSALGIGTRGANLVAGNSSASRLYLKLIGNQFGPQMPPTGPLSQDEVNIIKAWIDQGAEWPDDLSGDAPRLRPDPKADRIMSALRSGDGPAWRRMLRNDPGIANRKGPGGSTPLMYAALYGDPDSVRLLLEHGADPNLRNDASATALMWAVDDVEKTRLLLEHGADANARSEDGRTPLIIAAGRFGSNAVVKLLLDHGANPSANSPDGATPLSEAATAGDEAAIRTLIERGADARGAGLVALNPAMRAQCSQCVDMLVASVSRDKLRTALLSLTSPLADARSVKLLLDRGADINARDAEGRTAPMIAASFEPVAVDTVKLLIDRGADVNATSAKGQTALDFAKRHGDTPLADLLIKAGAKQAPASTEQTIKPQPAGTFRTAIGRSIPLLQRTDVSFIRQSGCVSCHHNSLTAMTIAAAQKNGLPIDDETAQAQLKTIATFIDTWRERALQGIGIPGTIDTISYILVGMAAENYPADAATDALARYLRNRQSSDGRWWCRNHRPPLEASDIEVTATSMRAIQVYGPRPQRREYQLAVRLAANWLAKAQPGTNEDRAFQLLGLAWAGANQTAIRKAGKELLAAQHSDGGWAQLPSLASDAYATGQALVALKEAGVLTSADQAYRRGVRFLLNMQLEDGSWYVKSRAIAIQPYFESGFPHGQDQWISAAATNWATMALIPASP